MSKYLVIAVILVLSAAPVAGIGPHEVVVLVNAGSSDSVEVAKKYCRMRDIPANNVVRLNLPEGMGTKKSMISREAFTRHIWAPARRKIKKKGIGDTAVAWIYSVDFPTKIGTQIQMSLHGLTFTRNRVPSDVEIKEGRYESPLFAGLKRAPGKAYRSQTFDVYREWLGDSMPLPVMSLGYTGERGSTKAAVLDCLDRGRESDYTSPSGTVYFVKQDDIRSKCRHWQFGPVADELRGLGVKARITHSFPSGAEDVIGLMIGKANVDPGNITAYRPGCMAEHLTSAAGIFSGAGQTKLTEWIDAGATASAGTVTEPYSIWRKFPAARFFVHYAAGCTVIESLYQSIFSPLQIMLVGDPLASPWSTRGRIKFEGLPEDEAAGLLEIKSAASDEDDSHYGRYLYLLDGRPIGSGREFSFDTRKVKDGFYKLRIVAYRTGLIRNQVYVIESLRIKNR